MLSFSSSFFVLIPVSRNLGLPTDDFSAMLDRLGLDSGLILVAENSFILTKFRAKQKIAE